MVNALTRSVVGGALVAAVAMAPAWAAEPPLQGVVGLSTSATTEVTKDLLTVTLTTTREGADAAAVQSALKQALDAALVEAKKVAKRGEIDVQTGNFSVFPRYTNKGVINGWQGSAELQIEGRDVPGIAKLTGRISTLSIGRVATNLSREQREKVEGDLAAEAIARYRTKAADYAKQFGYTGYVIREVTVGSSDPGFTSAPQMMRAKSSLGDEAALPVELGKGTVVLNVSGTVQLTK